MQLKLDCSRSALQICTKRKSNKDLANVKDDVRQKSNLCLIAISFFTENQVEAAAAAATGTRTRTGTETETETETETTTCRLGVVSCSCTYLVEDPKRKSFQDVT